MTRSCAHIPAAEDVRVEITFEPTRSHQERYLVQLSFSMKGNVIRAERRGPSPVVALHGAVARLDQLVARFKGQVYRSLRTRNNLSVSELQAAEAFELDRELARELMPEEETALAQ